MEICFKTISFPLGWGSKLQVLFLYEDILSYATSTILSISICSYFEKSHFWEVLILSWERSVQMRQRSSLSDVLLSDRLVASASFSWWWWNNFSSSLQWQFLSKRCDLRFLDLISELSSETLLPSYLGGGLSSGDVTSFNSSKI